MPFFILGSIAVTESTAETSTPQMVSFQRSDTAKVLSETEHGVDAEMAVAEQEKSEEALQGLLEHEQKLAEEAEAALEEEKKLKRRRPHVSNKFTLVKMQCAHRPRRWHHKKKLQQSQSSQLQS